MPARARLVYRESTPWPGWVMVVLWGTLSVAAVSVLVDQAGPLDRRLAWAGGLMALGGAIQWILGGTEVRLFRTHLWVGLGAAGWIGTRIAWDDVVSVDATHYSPLRDFGGWGYRVRPGKRAWTARGDEAVVLRMNDGREVYVGSDDAARLVRRIRAVRGS